MMQRRTKLATAAAVVLTLMSGIAAFGATTGLFVGEPEPSAATERSGDQVTPAGGRDTRTGGPDRSEPNGATQTASASGRGGVTANPASAPVSSAPSSEASPAPSTSAGASAAPAPGAPAPRPVDVDPGSSEHPPSTMPTTPAANPGPPAVDCHGSDDGMSEAEKQARERACQGADGGD